MASREAAITIRTLPYLANKQSKRHTYAAGLDFQRRYGIVWMLLSVNTDLLISRDAIHRSADKENKHERVIYRLEISIFHYPNWSEKIRKNSDRSN